MPTKQTKTEVNAGQPQWLPRPAEGNWIVLNPARLEAHRNKPRREEWTTIMEAKYAFIMGQVPK